MCGELPVLWTKKDIRNCHWFENTDANANGNKKKQNSLNKTLLLRTRNKHIQ